MATIQQIKNWAVVKQWLKKHAIRETKQTRERVDEYFANYTEIQVSQILEAVEPNLPELRTRTKYPLANEVFPPPNFAVSFIRKAINEIVPESSSAKSNTGTKFYASVEELPPELKVELDWRSGYEKARQKLASSERTALDWTVYALDLYAASTSVEVGPRVRQLVMSYAERAVSLSDDPKWLGGWAVGVVRIISENEPGWPHAEGKPSPNWLTKAVGKTGPVRRMTKQLSEATSNYFLAWKKNPKLDDFNDNELLAALGSAEKVGGLW